MEKEPFESLERGLDKDLSSLLTSATQSPSGPVLLAPLADAFGATGLSVTMGRSPIAAPETQTFRSLSDRFAQQIAVFPLANHIVMNEFGAFIPKAVLRSETSTDYRDERQRFVIRIQFEPNQDRIEPSETSYETLRSRKIPIDDPIFDIGKNPVACGVPDASENLDKYLYGG